MNRTPVSSPYDRCRRLDAAGDAYYLLSPPYRRQECILNVISYSVEWVEVRRETDGEDAAASFWVRWGDLAPFAIVEG